ncbi:MAG: DNA internalization-related competence protein ComEC/Rec2 [Acidobacteria bacterium]|nr:DNA internalization-related competence protein ComEC/Rec2 [Acidobacteriota bacterium]
MPLLAGACWFATGIAMARHWIATPLLIVAVFAFFFIATIALRLSLRVATLPVAALWITAGAWCWQLRPVPATQHDLLQYADGLSRTVRGHIVRVRELPVRRTESDRDNDPAWWIEREPEASGAVSVDIAVDAIEEVTPDTSSMVPMKGGVRTTIVAHDNPLPSLHCGDVVEMPLRIKEPQRYRDPGAWQYADYLLTQGIGAHATARAAKVRVAASDHAELQCRVFATQSWASSRILAYVRSKNNRRLPPLLALTEQDAGMLNAMLFGDRARLNHALRLGFERTGSFHLFVVSGMHVALLAGIILWMLRGLRIREWLATAITLPLMTAYALLTGFGAPVQRALFMTTVFLIARLLSRERSVLNALGAAALAELVWAPASLFEASFQMTFLAIFAIAGIAIPLGEHSFMPWARATRRLHELWQDPVLPPKIAQLRVMLRLWGEELSGVFGKWTHNLPALFLRAVLWIAELALIGLVAEMVMALPVALYFHRATIFALPANMLTIPIIGLLAPLAVIAFTASLISPWLAMLPAAATAMLLHGIGRIIARVSHVQAADLRVPGPALWAAMLAIAAWAFCIWAVRRSKRWASIALLALPLGTLAALWPQPANVRQGKLEITAIDVGQGDSLLVVSPEGRAMLVDAGGPVGGLNEAAATANNFDIGEEVVSPYLWSRNIRRLDVLVLSHAHSDHMGGMAAVMRNFRPRELWVSTDPGSDAYRVLIAQAAELGVKVRHLRAGDSSQWAGTQIKVLAPEPSYVNSAQPSNNDSLVLRIEYGIASVLLEGDAEAQSEQTILARGLAPVTLLKIGHHGSRSSTTPAFFAALAPKDAIVSVGKGNTFGHPREEVIQRVASGGTRLFRTDEFGLTTFLLDRDGAIHEVLGTQ